MGKPNKQESTILNQIVENVLFDITFLENLMLNGMSQVQDLLPRLEQSEGGLSHPRNSHL